MNYETVYEVRNDIYHRDWNQILTIQVLILYDSCITMATKQNLQPRYCGCKWDNCELLRETLQTNESENHVWCKNIIRLDFRDRNLETMSIQKYALLSSISRHILKEDDGKKSPSYIYLYPHHFPIALLTWMDQQSIRPTFF